MKTIEIDVARDFSDVPSGRFIEDGAFNGTTFRQKHLVPALRHYDRVIVAIDNTEGFGSSFLEEAFGGLIRHEAFRKSDLDGKLEIRSEQPRTGRYKRKIEQYIAKAERAIGAAK